jgi:TfoX/Sxy family transcriptional regulator of competence genes
MAFSEELASRVREILEESGPIEEKKMFGGLAFMIKGHMSVGITRDELMLRLGPEGAEGALAQPHVRPMDFTGRPMKGYVYVAAPGLKTEAKLRRWLDLAREFIATLPSK